jgi:quercetin dioxygenase-like cupin family protein
MQIKPSETVPQKQVDMEGAAGCQVRILVGDEQQAPNFVMRQFELDPGGHTPRHFHPYEHEIYMLQGDGVVVDGDTLRPLAPGDVVYVAPDDVHQFRNTGDTPMKMLCLIPNSATGKNVTVVPECGLEQQPK